MKYLSLSALLLLTAVSAVAADTPAVKPHNDAGLFMVTGALLFLLGLLGRRAKN